MCRGNEESVCVRVFVFFAWVCDAKLVVTQHFAVLHTLSDRTFGCWLMLITAHTQTQIETHN